MCANYKWCRYKNENVFCYGICDSCILTTPQQYNYKCPCGGEFMTTIYKWINTEVKEIGTDKIVANVGQGYYAYVCPFCGKIMGGMNGWS